MASTPIQFYAPAGLTLTLELYPYGSDAIANGVGGDAATEKTNAHGLYEATVTEAITGLHNAVIVDGSDNLIANYFVLIVADDTTVYRCSDDAMGMDNTYDQLTEILADVTGINGDAMRGTDNAALATVCTEARLSELDEATAGKMANQVDIIAGDVVNIDGAAMRGTDNAALATLFTGITSVAEWLGLLAGKQVGNVTARTELRATGAGSGTFDEVDDSLEAIRDRGDASWVTAVGFSTHTAVDVRTEMDANSIQFAKLGTPAADISADIAAIKAVLPSALVGGRMDSSVGAIVAAVQESLVDDVWDEVLTAGTHNVATSAGRRLRNLEIAGYQDGAVWVDTVNGSAGTDVGENGVPWNPSLTLADALTIASAAGLSRLVLAPGSSITLVASLTNFHVSGLGATVAFGGQAISGCIFSGTTVTGVATGTGIIQFLLCKIGTPALSCTLPPCHIHNSDIVNDITANAAGDYFLDKCQSNIAGVSTPSFDFGAAVGNVNLNMRAYSGGITLEAMGDLGTDAASIEGWGQVIEGTCTGGTVAIRGNFTVSGITNLTLSDDARIDVDQINAQADLALVDAAITTDWANDGRLDVILDAINASTAGLGGAAMRGTDNAFLATSAPTNFSSLSITAGGTVDADMLAINGSTQAANNLGASSLVIVQATVDTVTNGHTPTTTEFQCDDVTKPNANHFVGRVVIFGSGTPDVEATLITGYSLVGGIGQFTVDALVNTPANDDTLVIM